jgi:hypothetical protein
MAALAQLGPGTTLATIEIAPPSRESAFLAVTGQSLKLEPATSDQQAPDAVLA